MNILNLLMSNMNQPIELEAFNIGDLEIPLPVIQGGMGVGISLSGLASAVANMGGVGVISTVGIGLTYDSSRTDYKQNNIDSLRNEIRKAREKTSGILGVNIMSVLTNFSDLVKTSIEEGIDIIFSGAGLPLELPKHLEENSKTKLVPIVSSYRAAAILYQKWKHNFNYTPDAFVVEGPKAGGHLGFKAAQINDPEYSLENLVGDISVLTQKIKDQENKDVPLIAAGGIFTGNDAFQIMKHGADAVQLGTRFVATEECDAPEAFKQAYINASEKDIRIIQSPVGLPGRAINNKFIEEAYDGQRRPKGCPYNCISSCNPKTTLYCINEALVNAYKGHIDDGFVFAGANAYKITEISTVRKVFESFKQEFQQAKMNHQALNKIGLKNYQKVKSLF